MTGPLEEALPLLAWRTRKARCYLCTFSRRTERDDLKTILEHIRESDFAEAFTRSSGLCLPHLCAAMAIGRYHPGLPLLLAAHEKRWRDLSWELEEFARKFDYRYADEPKGRESSSWHRALEAFVGRPGLFGPEQMEWPPPDVPAQEDSAPVEGGDTQASEKIESAEVEGLRFENERLHRRVESLLAEREEVHRKHLALEFRVLKLTSDLKAKEVRTSDRPE